LDEDGDEEKDDRSDEKDREKLRDTITFEASSQSVPGQSLPFFGVLPSVFFHYVDIFGEFWDEGEDDGDDKEEEDEFFSHSDGRPKGTVSSELECDEGLEKKLNE